MNTELARALLIGVNALLLGGTSFVGYLAFRTNSPVPITEQIQSFDPTTFALQKSATNPRDISIFAPIWIAIRPVPPPPPPKPAEPVAPVAPQPPPSSVASIQNRYQVVGVNIAPNNPERSTCFIKRRGAPSHTLIKVGELIPETDLTLVGLRVDSPGKVTATLRDKAGKVDSLEQEIEITTVKGGSEIAPAEAPANPKPGERMAPGFRQGGGFGGSRRPR